MLNRLFVKKIIKAVKGFENIESFTNCGTRLRITVKNNAIVDYETINNLSKVRGITLNGNVMDIVFASSTIKYANIMESLMA